MKKLLVVFIVVAMLLGMVACQPSGGTDPVTTHQRIQLKEQRPQLNREQRRSLTLMWNSATKHSMQL